MPSKDHAFHPQCLDRPLPHDVDYSKSSSGLPLKVAVSGVHGSSLGVGDARYTTPKIKNRLESFAL